MKENNLETIGTGDQIPKGNTKTSDLQQGIYGLGPKYPYQVED